jgi:nucleoside-diphosphate-sugar epimerase
MVSCDAVVHLGAIAAPNRHPDERVFRDNMLSAFTVLQAAMLRG